MEATNRRFVEVYRARNVAQAHLITNALREAGIEAVLENDLLQGALGDLPPGWATAPRILVEQGGVEAARALIGPYDTAPVSEPEEDTAGDAPRCLACGGPMPEDQARCPACGWSFKEDQTKEDQAGG
jgi:hypothetical protein